MTIPSASIDEGLNLLRNGRNREFNRWRMSNLTLKLDFSGMNLSKAQLQGTYLNGVVAGNADFSGSNLAEANLVQAKLDGANFSGSNLSRTLLMYAEIKGCNFTNCDLSGTNMMWAHADGANFIGARFSKTILVEASIQNAKVGEGKSDSFLKYAKTDGTRWFDAPG